MKLYTCHVDNFGGLQDLDLDFRGNLHTIREENGWGKSTLAAFLLVMFYGFANEKSRSGLANERRRYAPWQQGVYGGSVTFSWRGRLLRLERVFGLKNAAEDQTTVYDAETNLPVEELPENMGETVFAIDRDSFVRTVFIAQQDCGTEATSGIQAKIGHLEGEAADMADFHQVQAALKKTTDKLTPHRKTGELYRLRQELAGLESDVAARTAYEQTLDRLQGQLEQRTRELEQRRVRLEAHQEEVRRLAVVQRSAEDLALDEETGERLQRLEDVFTAGTPDAQQLEEAEACLREIRTMRSDFDRLQRELYEPEEKEKPEESEQPGRSGTTPISVVVFGLFAAALLAFFVNRIAAAALAAAAIVIMVVVLRRDAQKEKEEGPKKPVVITTRRQSPLEATPFARAADQRAKKEELRKKRAEIGEAEGELLEFLRQYYPELPEDEDLSRRLQQLQYEQAEYASLRKRQERARAAEAAWKEQLRERETGEATGESEILSVEKLEQRIAVERDGIETAESEAGGIRRQIETAREELDHIAEAEERLAALRTQIEETQHRYEVISRTRDYLAEARTAFTARYMEPVRHAFDTYYSLLTGEEAENCQLDADLKITVREYGVLRDPAYLSEGWQDLIGLCRRMAMIDTMYEEEKPFLLFDDPFVNLDGEKLERALHFLQKIADRYQVIYFTCHESREP